MATGSDFTRTEWELLGNAPLAAGAAVALASPGGGNAEAAAIVTGWREAGASLAQSQLIQELVRDLDPAERERQERGSGGSPGPPSGGDIVAEARFLCDRALALLEGKATPTDVQDYQAFVLRLASAVARATKEGGFLSFGGTEISRNEQHVLRQIADALRFDG